MALSPDDIAASLAVNITTELFKSTYANLVEAEKWLRGKLKEADVLGLAARKYCNQLQERYSMVRILGMEKPVSLRDIYVNVNILEKITDRQRISLEALERLFDRDQRSFGVRRDMKSGEEAAATLDRFIVLGKPGAGKTTFLKYLLFQSLDGRAKTKRLPVFVSLKDFSDAGTPLLDYLTSELDCCGFPDARPFLVTALQNGKCQLLFDGMDEVSEVRQDAVIRELLHLSSKYPQNQFIISCRLAAYNHWFETFTDVEIADFSPAQIKQFISNWFAEEPKIAEQCWRLIAKDAPVRELATVPLLLTLLCLAFNETMEFPPNRAELYREALDALLKKWDSSRRIKRSDAYKHLSVKRKESMLSHIAAKTFQEGRYFIPQRQLEALISDFIQHLPRAREETLDPDSEAILKAIEAHHGIFTERAIGIYSFSHLTFQEYFTAQYIVEHVADGTLEKVAGEHLSDERWREVILLTACMLDSADSFLSLIKTQIDRIARKDGLEGLFAELDRIREQERKVPYPAVFTRCLALMNSIRTAAEVPYRGKHGLYLTKVAELLRAVERELPPMLDLGGSDAARGVMGELRRALKRARSNPEAIYFGPVARIDILKYNLGEYMRAYGLLLDCLGTECYVSRPVRKQLTSGLFAFT